MAFHMYSSPFFSDDSWFQPFPTDNDDCLASRSGVGLESGIHTWGIDDVVLDHQSMFSSESYSSTPSLCDEADRLDLSADTHLQTPTEEAPYSPEAEKYSPEASDTPSKRKRGRPRLTREDRESSYGDTRPSCKSRISKRQPHNEVERKYRNGLNAELERLRMAVPTLAQLHSQSTGDLIRPSKATVLAGAIEYIQQIQVERDRLQRENEALKAKDFGWLWAKELGIC